MSKRERRWILALLVLLIVCLGILATVWMTQVNYAAASQARIEATARQNTADAARAQTRRAQIMVTENAIATDIAETQRAATQSP